jgi:hypothetical protein
MHSVIREHQVRGARSKDTSLYEELDALLRNSKRKDSKPLRGMRSTWLKRRSGGAIAVQYHETDVVTVRANGSFQLNSGGWKTMTTKDRMNCYLPRGVTVFSERGIWYVTTPKRTAVYRDGMVIKKNGAAAGAGSELTKKSENALKQKVRAFAKAFIQALKDGKVGAPGPSDCWGCLGLVTTMDGEVSKNPDHLRQHVKDHYFVPSLLVTVLEVKGVGAITHNLAMAHMYPDAPEASDALRFGQVDRYGFRLYEAMEKALRSYVGQKLGLAMRG